MLGAGHFAEYLVGCPKCSAAMDVVEHGAVNIDRCGNCGGIWLDYLELERLRKVPKADQLDLATDVDAGFDEMVYVECPRCFSILDTEELEGPESLRFEVCRTCGGSFFDGGELSKVLKAG